VGYAKDGPGTSFHFILPRYQGEELMRQSREPEAVIAMWTTTLRFGKTPAADPVGGWKAETFASAQEFLARPSTEEPSCRCWTCSCPV